MITSISVATLLVLASGSASLQAEDVVEAPRQQHQSLRVTHGVRAMLQRSQRQMQTRAAPPNTGLKSVLLQLESFSEANERDGATVMVIIVLLTVCLVAGILLMAFSQGETDANGAPLRTKAMGGVEDPFLVNSYPSTPVSGRQTPNPTPRRSPLASASSLYKEPSSLSYKEPSGLSVISERSATGSIGGNYTLCPSLIVPGASSTFYKIHGTVQPKEQQETLEITDQGGALSIILYVFEDGRDSGILLESSSRMPLAFVDTSTAYLSKATPGSSVGFSPNRPPYVSISKASPIVGGRGSQQAFAVVSRSADNSFNVCQGRVDGPAMASVIVSGGKSQITDSSNNVWGKMEFTWGSATIHIQPGIDAGVVLCTFLATMKLGAHS